MQVDANGFHSCFSKHVFIWLHKLSFSHGVRNAYFRNEHVGIDHVPSAFRTHTTPLPQPNARHEMFGNGSQPWDSSTTFGFLVGPRLCWSYLADLARPSLPASCGAPFFVLCWCARPRSSQSSWTQIWGIFINGGSQKWLVYKGKSH